MKFLSKMVKAMKSIVMKMLVAIDQPIAQATVTTSDHRTGKELTSPLIEIAVRRAVSAVIVAAGAALSAHLSPGSQVTSQINDTFTRLIQESWYGGFSERREV